MEHSFKRRRIERRVARPLGLLRSHDNNQLARQGAWGSGEGLVAAPKLVVTPQPDSQARVVEPQRIPARRPWRLSLRDLVPAPVTGAVNKATEPVVEPVAKPATDAVTNAAQPAKAAAQPATDAVANAAQPVTDTTKPAAQAVGGTVNNAAQPVEQAAAPVTEPLATTVGDTANQAQQPVKNAVQPVQNQVNDAAAPITQPNPPAAEPPAVVNPPASNPVPPPVDNVPGIVSPPAAQAAQDARKQALAQQEAAAASADSNVPGEGGPPPPAAAAAASADDATLANGAIAEKASPASISLQIPDTNTQRPLSEPSTPLPPTPTPPQSASYFAVGQSDSPAPTANAANLSPPSGASSNSTMASQTTGTNSRSSSVPVSSLFASTQSTSAETGTLGSVTATASGTAATSSFPFSSFGFHGSSTLSTITTSNSANATSSLLSAQPTGSSTGGEGFVGATSTSGEPAGSTTTAASPPGGGNGMPPTKTLVGGICGGIAGLVLIVAALLFLLRWRKGKMGQRRDISPPVPQTAEAGSAALGGGGALTQRSSTRSTAPMAAAASLIGRLRPASSQTATTSSTGPSEKGFQKISGRKLPSVLHSGGDGYGDAPVRSQGGLPRPQPKAITPGQGPFAGLAPSLRPPSPQRSLSGSSFYRDSHGFYGGVVPVESASDNRTDPSSSPTSSSPTFPAPPSSGAPLVAAGHPPGRSSPGVPNIRPGPARQPIIQQGGVVPMRTPSRPGTSQQRNVPSPITESPRDALGRSHPSQDGSRQSRFRESTTPP